MILFYCENINDGIAELPEDEAMHCVRTLRKKVGDTIHLVDGKGGWHVGNIIETSKKKCTVSIQSSEYKDNRSYKIHVAIAPTKNIDRLNWFLEKCTEMGIDEITPIKCKHSERKVIRNDRLNRIIVAAMKQSLKAHLPKLNELISFKAFVTQSKAQNIQKFIAHCEEEVYQNGTGKTHLFHQYEPQKDVLILIGPEGDFSSPEIKMALDNDFKAVSLGDERLRTETAGVAACHTIHIKNIAQ